MVLVSVCFTRSIYHTKYSASQQLFVKFKARCRRKWYNIESFPKYLHQLDVNEGNFILTWNSGNIVIIKINGESLFKT